MNTATIPATPRIKMRSTFPPNTERSARWRRDFEISEDRHERRPRKSLMAIDGYRLLHERQGKPLSRFFTYFGGPIAWALEVAAVLLIIVSHQADFVSVVVAANLMMMVMMMAFKAGLGFWHAAHPAISDDDALNRHPASRPGLHHS